MSVWGQTRRFDLLSITSDMPSTSDVSGPGQHFAKVPVPEVSTTTELTMPLNGRVEGSSDKAHDLDQLLPWNWGHHRFRPPRRLSTRHPNTCAE